MVHLYDIICVRSLDQGMVPIHQSSTSFMSGVCVFRFLVLTHMNVSEKSSQINGWLV